MNIQIRLGKTIRKLRKAKGLSQETFAFKCGLDRTYISSVERGKRNVSLHTIQTIARGLDVSISELFEIAECEESK